MKGILECAGKLKGSEVRKLVDSRLREFKILGEQPSNEIFKELCFCILTANFQAERAIRIQGELGDGFLKSTEKQLAKRLKELGHRYPNTRANYIAEARKHRGSLRDVIRFSNNEDGLREWFVKNVKGLGYKEASHFLRNIGFENLAIIDFHIIDILANHNVIEKPKTLTRGKYLEIENVLKRMASELDMNLAELDLYLWYAETGKILK